MPRTAPPRLALAGLLALGPAACAAPPRRPPPDLASVAARTNYAETGRYDEVVRLCAGYERAFPGRVRCATFGQSPEGRPLLALVASDDGTLDPAAARAKGRPALLVQGGIHAGEIEGKDAGFLALRALLDGRIARGALGRFTLVFVPAYNADGHERFGPNNRPNQRGPARMGFRTTAQRINLNRDYAKAEAPETRAMLALYNAWDPTVYADLHTTDGAKFQHDVAVLVSPDEPLERPLDRAARALDDALQARLKARHHLPLPFYPSFRADDDPASGFAREAGPPRFSHPYAGARNRIGILVETHSWRAYGERVRATYDLLEALFTEASAHAAAWREAGAAADRADARLGGTPVALAFRTASASRPIDFRGYAYRRAPSDLSGGPRVTYDESKPQIWRVPYYDTLEPAYVETAPRGGYVVPAAHAAWVGPKLALHGVRFTTLRGERRAAPIAAFRASSVAFDRPFEGRTRARVEGAWRPERRDLPPGSLFVPIDQPRARLAMHLLEPRAPDSLVAWGYFNAAFEQKEFMEPYVAEDEGRRMLERDPALRRAFEERLRTEPEFAASPEARLRFFYERHPAWDEEFRLVPIFRVDAPP
ncbi:MAG TPA: M14 family zinc carboxypeptidase [Polyangiaceae bacterium]|nr:M14 family zinc carboxypeptidase [Polyangiaceae bacterium]